MRNDFFKHILLSGVSRQNRTELETETLPYTFNSNSYRLRNYRIYGNTVNGESVGDRTANLFNADCEQGSVSISGNLTNSDNRIRARVFLSPNTTYALKSNLLLRLIYGYTSGGEKIGMIFQSGDGAVVSTFTTPDNVGYIIIAFMKYGSPDITVNDFEWCMLNYGSTVLPYEPYGYRVPVTVTNGMDTQTTNLYLPEQIKIVGDEAEYVDSREQKQHLSDGTSVDVTLPVLPTLKGTNTLSVGTTVQPSKIWIQGNISEIETVSTETQALQTNMQSLQPLSLDENAELEPSDKNEFQTNDISEMPVEDENSIEEILETENLETTGDGENAE